MAETVEECRARAAACRAAANSEALENVRRLHLDAAEKWEALADQASQIANSCEAPRSAQFGMFDFRMTPRSAFDWPRNARLLQAEPIHAPASRDRYAPTAEEMPEISILSDSRRGVTSSATKASSSSVILYAADGGLRTLEEIEVDVIRLAIGLYHGRLAEVARRLGIGRSTLYRKLSDLGIEHSVSRSEHRASERSDMPNGHAHEAVLRREIAPLYRHKV